MSGFKPVEPFQPASVEYKGGGPKTAEGKARAARNAMRHGLSLCMTLGEMTFDQAQTVLDYAWSVQAQLTRDLEIALEALENQDTPARRGAFDQALKRLVGVERYMGRSFTKRQTAIRRGPTTANGG